MSCQILSVFLTRIDGIILQIVLGLVETVSVVLLNYILLINRRMSDFVLGMKVRLVLLIPILALFIETLDIDKHLLAIDLDPGILPLPQIRCWFPKMSMRWINKFGFVRHFHPGNTVQVTRDRIRITANLHTLGFFFFL